MLIDYMSTPLAWGSAPSLKLKCFEYYGFYILRAFIMSAQKSELSNPARLPRHIAIVMDGNGRWAKKRFLPRMAGHYAGYKALKRTVQNCIDIGIEVLTIFAFSS